MSPRWRIERHDTLDSTMTRARALAQQGAPAGTVVVANYQTRGQGSRGRVWLAPPGSCLMFTVIARPALAPADLERVPLRVAASVADAIHDACGLSCDMKEPNDLIINGRKVCGVLCASHISGDRVEWALCGVGLNTHMAPADLPLPTATSLAAEGVPIPPHDELLPILLRRLEWLIDE